MSKPDWLAHKTSLDLDFPNLPYYQVLAFPICLLGYSVLSYRCISKFVIKVLE